MSLDTVRADLAVRAPDLTVMVTPDSTATVDLAAAVHGVAPGQIAKTLAIRVGEREFLLVTRGDARLSNQKAKAAFGGKASMLAADEVAQLTGHPIGGVCPFGLVSPLPIYCDVKLRDFEVVIPAAGAPHASLKIEPGRLSEITGAAWVDVCQG